MSGNALSTFTRNVHAAWGPLSTELIDECRRQGGALLRAADGAAPEEVERPAVFTGALEQSNVSVVERVAELTNVSRNFEALQKAVSVLMNDIDGRTIDSIARR